MYLQVSLSRFLQLEFELKNNRQQTFELMMKILRAVLFILVAMSIHDESEAFQNNTNYDEAKIPKARIRGQECSVEKALFRFVVFCNYAA